MRILILYSDANNTIQDVFMKIFKILAAVVTIVMLAVSCATDLEKLKKESKEAYPNQEWRRPPAHWSPP